MNNQINHLMPFLLIFILLKKIFEFPLPMQNLLSITDSYHDSLVKHEYIITQRICETVGRVLGFFGTLTRFLLGNPIEILNISIQ